MNKAQKLLIKARCNDLAIGTNEDGTDLYVSDIMLDYHQEQVKNFNIDDASKCPYCKSDDVSDIEGVMWCSGCDSTY